MFDISIIYRQSPVKTLDINCYSTMTVERIRNILHFYDGMIILVNTKPLCIGMAWLPFQKFQRRQFLYFINPYFKKSSVNFSAMFALVK